MLVFLNQDQSTTTRWRFLQVQYSTVQGIFRIRVKQQDGGSSRYNTVQYKVYLGLEFKNKMLVSPGTIQYSTSYIQDQSTTTRCSGTIQYSTRSILGYHYNNKMVVHGVIQYHIICIIFIQNFRTLLFVFRDEGICVDWFLCTRVYCSKPS